MNQWILYVQLVLPVLFPVICGLAVLGLNKKCTAAIRNKVVLFALAAEVVITLASFGARGNEIILWYLAKDIPIAFSMDNLTVLFMALLAVVWLFAGIFSFEYMKHEDETEHAPEHTKSLSGSCFYGCYLLVLGSMNGIFLAGNLVTFYLFYEFMTVLSVPFVLHTMTKEAVYAAKKYLFYSIAGVSFAVFGFAFLYGAAGTLTFIPGGVFANGLPQEKETILLLSAFLMIIGFGTKAGMFPMHGWLPSAHPVAPAPASAVLSGIITKAGVLGIIRIVFYLFGVDNLAGTWVQTAFLILTLVTVFMGSMLAYKEQILKKRLAYSTVSQVSYVLFGIALMHPVALTGALLHVVCHSVMKCTLFMNAGAIIYKTERTKVADLKGIGKEMPVTMWTFAIAAVGMVGIPPFCGFISKWYLCQGALESGMGVFEWLGPVVLLASALLTAGYLVSVVINAFFPGEEYDYAGLVKKEPNSKMLLPMLLFAGMVVILGFFPQIVTGVVSDVWLQTIFGFLK